MADLALHLVDGPQESASLLTSASLRAALALLAHARDCALNTRAAPWDFAVEIGELCAAGLTVTDLRWLVVKGLVAHGSETSLYGDKHRSFTRSNGFNFLATTCFVLTNKGASFARGLLQDSAAIKPAEQAKAANERSSLHGKTRSWHGQTRPPATPKPRWNPELRELSLGGFLVKRFLVPARNQESILSAFQEEGWPEHIDDPLIGKYGMDLKNRLNDVVFRLNRTQIEPLIRFHTNGRGNGIRWSLCDPESVRRRVQPAMAAPSTR